MFDSIISNGSNTFLDAEKEILGFDHAGIASEVCKGWKIPNTLSSAICYHHYPSRSSGNTLAYIVHVADCLALMSGIGAGIDGMLYRMDEKAMEFLGLSEDDLSTIIEETVESIEKITEQLS